MYTMINRSRPAIQILLAIILILPLHARTWTSSSGKTIEAEWIKTTATSVSLKLASGKTTTFKLSLLSQADQEYARQLAKEAFHPLNWKPLQIQLDEAKAEIEAIAMPGSFKRVGAEQWQATLPPGCWIKIRYGTRTQYDRTLIFAWDGSPSLTFERRHSHIYQINQGKPDQLVSISIRGSSLDHDQQAVKELQAYKDVDCLEISGHQTYDSKILRQLNPKAVYLHGVIFRAETYQQLSQLSRLKTLSTSSQVGHIEGIQALNQLEALQLTGGLGTRNCQALSGLTKLRQLNIGGGGSLRDVSWLKSLKQLQALQLLQLSGIKSSELIAHLPRLHSFQFPINLQVKAEDISQMPNLTRLSYLSLAKNEDPTPLFGLKQLSDCMFGSGIDGPTLNQWKRSGGLGHLKSMAWFNDFDDMQGFESLRHLKTDVSNRSNIDKLTRLITLELSLPYSEDHAFLGKLLAQQKQLRSLTLKNAKISSLAGLPALSGIKVLKLDNCSELTSLKGYEQFPSLELIILNKCKKLSDYSGLQGGAQIAIIESSGR